MPCWSIHQPMSSTEDHRAITGRPGMVDFWRRSGMPWCLGVRFGLGAWVVDGRFLPSDSFPHSRSRHRTRGPVARPVSEDEDLDGSGTCRKSVLEPWLKSHGKRRGSLLVPKGSLWIQIFDPSEDLALRWTCWLMSVLICSWNVEVFLRFLFFWLPARFIR